jgi:hypothetical protein
MFGKRPDKALENLHLAHKSATARQFTARNAIGVISFFLLFGGSNE